MSSSPEDAAVLIKKAEQSLKTSLFKRTPDYDSAIEYYTKAALIYRNSKSLGPAAEIYHKIAELNLKTGSYFQCAKNYEIASLLYKDMQQFERSAELIVQAGEFLQRCGAMDSAAYVYARAAKSLEPHLPKRAAEFYEKAADACEVEEKYNEAADHYNSGARIYVRLRHLADSERLLRLYITHCQKGNHSTGAGCTGDDLVYRLIARAVMLLVLFKLYQSDEIAARKVHDEASQKWKFNQTEEGCLSDKLISAYEQRDGRTATQLLQHPCLRNLDLSYTDLIRELAKKFKDELTFHKDDSTMQSRPVCETNEAGQPESSVSVTTDYGDDDNDIC